MTTPQAKSPPVVEQWEPYPHLEKEEKDMQQGPPEEDLIVKLRSALTPGRHYPHHPHVLIGTEIPIYYGERDPATRRFPHIRPDILIALDVDAEAIWRRVGYDPIQNGKPPDAVVEIASPSTYRNDASRKRDIYQMLEVPEYWRFDPTGGRMFGQAVIGEQLIEGRYQRLPLLHYPGSVVGSTSPRLNLNFRYQGNQLFTIHDPETGREYEHPEQRAARLEEEIRRLRGS
ncbi:MAG: Uma2 family endonuclease [Chloroflexota bacterium]|nr:Uma2 family endonuclease [Chloroflexota bacterium]MDE2961427.1 Uma2 family endonuclease [Chloroflexota bacterium]